MIRYTHLLTAVSTALADYRDSWTSGTRGSA